MRNCTEMDKELKINSGEEFSGNKVGTEEC